MNTQHTQQNNHSYLLWPLAVLVLLTIGVFLTTREIPKEQDIRSRAQVEEPIEEDLVIPEDLQTGAVFNVSFSLPGIASQAGSPVRQARPIQLLFYNPDSNTADLSVKPLYTLDGQVTFDKKNSTFVITDWQPQETPPEGDYQVGLKTDQALIKIIKQKETDLRGKIFALNDFTIYDLDFGRLLTGDIVPLPHGDNAVDVADYNELINCYGIHVTSDTCTAKTLADLDDNGVVDGIDYNIMLVSFRSLLSRSVVPVVSAAPSPSPTIIVQPTAAVTAPPEATGSKNTVWDALALLVVFLIFSAGILMLFRHKIPFLSSFGNGDKEYFIKQDAQDEKGWFTLAGDSGQIRGHYAGGEIKDGFAKVRGEMKSDGTSNYLEISKIVWEDKD